MRRREFIKAIAGSVAVAWPPAARAQQQIPVVAFLSVGSPEIMAGRVAGFRKGLSETGFAEGQNVLIEYHWLGGQYERLKTLLGDRNAVSRLLPFQAAPLLRSLPKQ
jgi:putative ABC transport system substrate-binding protein